MDLLHWVFRNQEGQHDTAGTHGNARRHRNAEISLLWIYRPAMRRTASEAMSQYIFSFMPRRHRESWTMYFPYSRALVSALKLVTNGSDTLSCFQRSILAMTAGGSLCRSFYYLSLERRLALLS